MIIPGARFLTGILEGVAGNAISEKLDAEKREITTELETKWDVYNNMIGYTCKHCGAVIFCYFVSVRVLPKYCTCCGAKVVKRGER